MSILPIETSTGSRASMEPIGVSEQSTVDNAACSCRRSRALSIDVISGGSTNGNFLGSLRPMEIICNISESSGTRRISGVEYS